MTESRRVARAVGAAVVGGALAPGDAVPTEGELAARYGVSRTVVREALKMLAAKGLVRQRPREGGRVSPRADWSLMDPDVLGWMAAGPVDRTLAAELIVLRLGVEPLAAELAAERRDAHALAALDAAVASMAAGEPDPVAADIAFHQALLAASGNRFLAHLGHLVAAALRVGIATTNAAKGVGAADLAAHAAIADSIAAGRPHEARARVVALLKEAAALIETEGEP